MSLINKMLQDLDQRHATDGGGKKTLTEQLRPVPTRKNWQRVMWEVGIGVLIGAGWALWVMYQISPRSIVTDLAFQSQGNKHRTAGMSTARMPQQPVAVPAAPVPEQTAAAPAPAQAAAAPAAATMTAPDLPATTSAESVNADILKLATEISTPFREKTFAATPKTGNRRVAPPAARPVSKAKAAPHPMAKVAPAPEAHRQASIDKQVHMSTPTERAENEFRKATALLNEGRVAEAIDGYKSTLQQDPAHAAARQALVGLLLEARRIDEAQPLLREGLNLNPDRSDYAMLLARIQVERGDLEGAHDLLRKHAGRAAGDADYHAFDAALLQRLGRHKEAVAGYEAALRLAPRAGLWWMGMGISLQAENRSAEALDAFRRARAVGGLSPDLLAFVDQRMKQLK